MEEIIKYLEENEIPTFYTKKIDTKNAILWHNDDFYEFINVTRKFGKKMIIMSKKNEKTELCFVHEGTRFIFSKTRTRKELFSTPINDLAKEMYNHIQKNDPIISFWEEKGVGKLEFSEELVDLKDSVYLEMEAYRDEKERSEFPRLVREIDEYRKKNDIPEILPSDVEKILGENNLVFTDKNRWDLYLNARDAYKKDKSMNPSAMI